MTTAEPLVSVLTPSFNQRRWLGDNLESVARQTYPRIEHLVMDGGSTDGSVEVLRAAGETIRWRSEPDRGQSHALNKAFADSRGEIIGWLNSDDAYFYVDAVTDAVAIFRANPGIDVVYGHAALVNARGLILQMIWVPVFSELVLRWHNFIIQPAAFIRRSALDGELVNERYEFAMDAELWVRLASKGCAFSRLDRVVAIDRQQPLRKSTVDEDKIFLEVERLVREYPAPSRARRSTRAQLKMLKIAFRLIGVRLAWRALPDLAFQAEVDSRLRLAVRQIAVKRADMPGGM
jgi:glycosyltransferase involved in cell wall biosynthesis